MNFSSDSWQQVWHVLGWTMILFLAAGTVVFLIGGTLRIALKRANPRVRYATSLAVFAVLAVTPLAIAGYLVSREPERVGDERSLEITMNLTSPLASPERQRRENAKFADVSPSTNEIPQSVSREAERVVDERSQASQIAVGEFLNQSVPYLPWVWCIGTPFTFLLLATGLVGAERLRSSCELLADGPIRTACDELRTALGIGRQVGVAVCERIATPLLVGVVKPLILLPPAALNGWTTAELEMVLVHELSHVRRWDNAVNLVQRVVESLLFFHPAAWIVSGWVRRDREDCCDAAVVRHTAKPQAYAELLLALASHQPLAGLAATAMAHHPLASRIRRILKLEDEPMLVTRKGLIVGVSAVIVATLLVFALPTTDAEETVSRERPEVSREAERVADERAETTNPTRQRGEEQTTNPTNDTNPASRERQRPEELTTEDTESTEKKKKASLAITGSKGLGTNFPNLDLSDEDRERIVRGLKSQGFDARLVKTTRTDGQLDNILMVRIPQDMQGVINWEQHPDGLQARVILFDKSGRVINAAADEPALNGLTYPVQGKTTNPTNDTNQQASRERQRPDLNAESAKGAEDAKNPLFPTLAEQRAADLAYKLLGVELEKLTPEELERVKAKGYEGGLKVTGPTILEPGQPNPAVMVNDLLVGLHVWPTESLEQVTEILSRNDLDQLSPLKFYVVRGGGPVRNRQATDVVVTGRIKVDLDAWRAAHAGVRKQAPVNQKVERRRTEQDARIAVKKYNVAIQQYDEALESNSRAPGSVADSTVARLKQSVELALSELQQPSTQLSPQETTNPGPAATYPGPRPNPFSGDENVLFYDGKTFAEWRSLWKTELKTEKRIECIQALAAFGRAGKGQEAAEAILDVAAEYDFRVISDGSSGELKQAITEVLVGNEGFPGQYWLPLLIEQLQTEPDRWSSFAAWMLSDVQGKDVIPYLKQLAKDSSLSADARGAALAGLAGQPDIADDPGAVAMVREALQGDKPVMQILFQQRFNRIDLFPELFELLFHKNEQIRSQALGIAASGGFDSEPTLNKLLEMLDDPARSEDREKCIVALYKLKGYFISIRERRQRVTAKITDILIRGDDELLPAALAIMSALIAKDEGLVIDQLGDKITDERRKELESAIEKAEDLKTERGGAGGMGGGGMF